MGITIVRGDINQLNQCITRGPTREVDSSSNVTIFFCSLLILRDHNFDCDSCIAMVKLPSGCVNNVLLNMAIGILRFPMKNCDFP